MIGASTSEKRSAFSGENVIGSPAMTVQFKAHPTFVEEIPAAALSELLVDQNARKCLRFGHGKEVLSIAREDAGLRDKRRPERIPDRIGAGGDRSGRARKRIADVLMYAEAQFLVTRMALPCCVNP
jgi:hypothetical protein